MAKSNKTPKTTATTADTAKKTTCPVSREDFAGNARPIVLTIDGKPVGVDAKEFSTGSFGYHGTEKITIMIGDIPVKFQVNVVITAIGSKDLPA